MTVDSINMPYFKGVPRQRGRGLGALALSVARTAIPIFRNFIVPAAKKVGRDFIKSAVPEIGEVVSGNQSLKRALRSSAKSTIKKQVGGGSVGGSTSKKRRVTVRRSTRSSSRRRRRASTRTSTNRGRRKRGVGNKRKSTRKTSTRPIKRKKKSQSRSREDFFKKLID